MSWGGWGGWERGSSHRLSQALFVCRADSSSGVPFLPLPRRGFLPAAAALGPGEWPGCRTPAVFAAKSFVRCLVDDRVGMKALCGFLCLFVCFLVVLNWKCVVSHCHRLTSFGSKALHVGAGPPYQDGFENRASGSYGKWFGGPAFGRTNYKTLVHVEFLFLWVMCCHYAFFSVYFYGWVFGCLSAIFHLQWWRRGSNILFSLCSCCLDFLVSSRMVLLHPSRIVTCHSSGVLQCSY